MIEKILSAELSLAWLMIDSYLFRDVIRSGILGDVCPWNSSMHLSLSDLNATSYGILMTALIE